MRLGTCSFGGHPLGGRSYYVYPAVLHEDDAWRAKLKLCSAHWAELDNNLLSRLVSRDLEVPSDSDGFPVCFACHKSIEDRDAVYVFATVYPHKDQRQDLVGLAHPVHLGEICENASLTA